MRLGVGLLCVFDALNRLAYFKAFYSYAGLIPLREQIGLGSRLSSLWSVMYMSDSAAWALLVLVVYALAGVALTLGYRARLAGWLCWILAISIQRRSPMLNDSGDMYLVTLLLWGNLLPWARAFSLSKESGRDHHYRALPGFGYITQVAILYWFSAVLRTGSEWQVDLSALYFALQIPSMVTPFGSFLLSCGTGVLKFFTFATLLFEELGPILLFLPSQRIRALAVAVIVSFHFGILLCIRIPFFATLCMIGALGLLPALFWESRPGAYLESTIQNAIIEIRRLLKITPEPAGRSVQNFERVVTVFVLVLIITHLYAGIFSNIPQTPLSSIAGTLKLNQRWGMFSPHATNVIGWETAVGLTGKGQEVDLLGNGEWPKKPWQYANHLGFFEFRWRLYQQALSYGAKLPLQAYLRYLVERWKSDHPGEELLAAQYVYHPRVSAPHYLLGEEGDETLATWRKMGESR